MHYLENHTIRLRALEPEDLSLLYAWENDSSIWQSGDTLTPYSQYILRQYIASAHKDIYEQKQLRLVIEQKGVPPQPIGLVDLFDIDFTHKRAAVGILIYKPECRQKGHALASLRLVENYCFNLLGLHQLYCNIATHNIASLKLFEKAGYAVAGVKKDWRKTPSGWQDELLLQLIKNE